MPFGLTIAPAVFQRLMTQVFSGLNPLEGPDFVAIYIDDILIFLKSLQDHLWHIEQILAGLQSAALKLQPAKCHFMCKQEKHLGHHSTGTTAKSGENQGYYRVHSSKVCYPSLPVYFLTFYYRWLIKGFAKMAAPLHYLTKKDMEFQRTVDCQKAFN